MKESKVMPSEIVSNEGIGQGFILVGAFVLLFFTILFYTNAVLFQDQEITALLVTIYLFGGVYTGRYIAQLWVPKNRTIPNWILILLTLTIVVCFGWILVYVEVALSKKTFLNILFLAFPFLLLSLTIGIFIKLIRTIIKSQLRNAKIQAEQSKSELNLLQSQLSPHFLFNTLNNMYGISISQHEKVPALLLKLSELLRYSVYDARELFVPLKSEITYINNYIDFEKIRIGERLILNTSIDQVLDNEIKIAPMLLIVFIENAFKHAKNTADPHIIIDIGLKALGQSILFSVKNSFSGSNDGNSLLNKNSGLGLENASKRLQLLYASDYDLKIQIEEGFYSVFLQLKGKYDE